MPVNSIGSKNVQMFIIWVNYELSVNFKIFKDVRIYLPSEEKICFLIKDFDFF